MFKISFYRLGGMVFNMEGHPSNLNYLFKPRSIAVVGASENPEKMSGQPLRNLLKLGYTGKMYAINRRVSTVAGIKSYKSLSDIGEPIDVAMICLPRKAAIDAAEECSRLKIPFAIIAVSGFGEVGDREGNELQQRLAEIGKTGTRIVGPNCNGIYNVIDNISIGYNVTHGMKLNPGNVALISHSGALFNPYVQLGKSYGLGYSYFVSAGNESDLNLLDYFEFMVEDDHTTIISLILDGIKDVQRFRKLCKLAHEKGKKITALKLGDSKRGSETVVAHSSRLAGSSKAYQALFAECGVVQAFTLESLLGCNAILGKYNLTESSNVVGLSTSGAGCAILADTGERYHVSFPKLDPMTIQKMDEHKGFGTPMNPFDVGASGPAQMEYMTRVLANDPSVGYVLFYSTQLQTKKIREEVAYKFAKVCEEKNRIPFLVIAPGPLSDEEMKIYREFNILVFRSSDSVFQAISAINQARHSYQKVQAPLQGIDIKLSKDCLAIDPQTTHILLEQAGIPYVDESIVNSFEELKEGCESIGYPVVIKGISSNLTHKSDMGLVWLNIRSQSELNSICHDVKRLNEKGIKLNKFLVQEYVSSEVEVLVGIHKDPDVGLLLVIGSGGKYSEVLDDTATLTIPATKGCIKQKLATLKIGKILSGYRNNGLSPDGIVDIAYQLQRIVINHENVFAGIDLNPVKVSKDKAIVVDARFILDQNS